MNKPLSSRTIARRIAEMNAARDRYLNSGIPAGFDRDWARHCAWRAQMAMAPSTVSHHDQSPIGVALVVAANLAHDAKLSQMGLAHA